MKVSKEIYDMIRTSVYQVQRGYHFPANMEFVSDVKVGAESDYESKIKLIIEMDNITIIDDVEIEDRRQKK